MDTHIVVEEIDSGERETVSGGRTLMRGRSLASLIDELGGYVGEVTLWTGEKIPVSLEKWRGSDPDVTWLSLQVVSDDVSKLPFRLSPASPSGASEKG